MKKKARPKFTKEELAGMKKAYGTTEGLDTIATRYDTTPGSLKTLAHRHGWKRHKSLRKQAVYEYRRYNEGELEEIKEVYENDLDASIANLAEAYGTTPGSLRAMAHRRGWKRPPEWRDNTGKPLYQIPENRYNNVRQMWEAGTPPRIIGNYLGISDNCARDVGNREFGYRNLREAQRTHYARRNRQIYNLRKNGVTNVELADMYWVSTKTIADILTRMQKIMGKLPKRIKPRTLDEAKRLVLDKEFLEEIERHEAYLKEIVGLVADLFQMPTTNILSATRGTRQEYTARQICMYIMHVEAGVPDSRLAMLFGRDRSTASHSSKRVEDYRDDIKLDEDLEEICVKFVQEIKDKHGFIPPYELYFSV